MKNPIIKVCGMRDTENIRATERLDIDWMGFIFYPKSPRYVQEKPSHLPRQKRIGVFVNASLTEIAARQQEYDLDGIQLHGDETPDFCRKLRNELKKCNRPVILIKAFGIASDDDLPATTAYSPWCDLFLFDTKTPLKGGSGTTFDWDALERYKGETPFLLSGGVSIENADKLKNIKNDKFAGVDLNSKFETAPALKDTEKLKLFIQKIRNHE